MTKSEILELLDKTIAGGCEMAITGENDSYYKGILHTVWTLIGVLMEREDETE